MVDFAIIATLLYTIGIEQMNISYRFKGLIQEIKAFYEFESVKITIEISENIAPLKEEKPLFVFMAVNETPVFTTRTKNIHNFYSNLNKLYMLLLLQINYLQTGKGRIVE